MSNTYLPSVAVVILSWNGKKYLESFIPILLKTTYQNVQFIVADNASTDGTTDYIKQHFPEISIINIAKNEGFAQGYNTALQQVKADIYVLLNQDVAVTPNWIEPVVKLFEQDEKVAVVQPKIKAYNQPNHFEYAGAAGGFIDWLGYPFCRGRIFDTVEEDKGQYESNIPVFWASGAAMFIKSKIYHEVGGLDADFFAHMEEIDLCWRVQLSGNQLMYCHQSTVYHVGGGSLPYGNPKKTYLNYRNNLVMMLKNNQSSWFVLVFFLRLILDGISAAQLLLKGKWRDIQAIFMANVYVYLNFKDILAKRKQVHKLIKEENATHFGMYHKSIVWQYFIKGKKRYNQLFS